MIAAGFKLYDTCQDCGKLIRINKPIFGSLHICLTEEEIAAKAEAKRHFETLVRMQKALVPHFGLQTPPRA